MSRREPNRRDNDALQSGEGDLAVGQDEREFGAGGQKVQRALGKHEAANRDVDRDPTVPAGQSPSGSGRKQQ